MRAVYQFGIIAHSIAHQAQLAIIGHPTISSAKARARRYTCGVGAVADEVSIARVGIGFQRFALIGGTYKQGAVNSVDRKHVPKTLDAPTGGIAIEKCGVRKVKAYILHPHHYPTACKGLGQLLGGIHLASAHLYVHRVEQRARALLSLDTTHAGIGTQSRHAAQWHLHNANVAILPQHGAAMLGQSVSIGGRPCLHKSTHLRLNVPPHRFLLWQALCLVAHPLSQLPRQFAILRLLPHGGQWAQQNSHAEVYI